MKVGIIIPDRGDRPAFMANCLRMMDNQTVKPERIVIMNYQPESNAVDITQRYRRGYMHLAGKGLDAILLIENDDWYASNYIETMLNAWKSHGKPAIFGTNYTVYYHIGLKKYYTMYHQERASAMNTLLKPDLRVLTHENNWPADHEPYTDLHLWRLLNGYTFKPEHHISLGIKHGVGQCGGESHKTRLHRYNPPRGFDDINPGYPNGFLKATLDPESFEFYNNVKI